MTKENYLEKIHNQIPSDVRVFDTIRFTQHGKDHTDVILCNENDWNQLVNEQTVDTIPLICLSRVSGVDRIVVSHGKGNMDVYDVSNEVGIYPNVQDALEETFGIGEESDK